MAILASPDYRTPESGDETALQLLEQLIDTYQEFYVAQGVPMATVSQIMGQMQANFQKMPCISLRMTIAQLRTQMGL